MRYYLRDINSIDRLEGYCRFYRKININIHTYNLIGKYIYKNT